jgi:replication factor A1
MTAAAAGFMPLAELSPFSKNWIIKGRVTEKDRAPREFTRQGGAKGQVQSIEIMDETGADIKVTFWNEAVEKFNFVKKGEVYTLKGGSVKMKQKKYNNTGHSYEISIDNNPLIQMATVEGEGAAGFENVNPFQNKKFTKLDVVATMPLPATVDILVMVKSQQDPREIKPRNPKAGEEGKVVWARTLEVVDDTTNCLEVTVWDQERCDDSLVGRCYAIQRCYIKEYNSRSATTSIDKMTVDPPVPEAEALKAWWESGGRTGKVTQLSDQSGGVREGAAVDTMEGTLAEMHSMKDTLVGDKKVDFTTIAYLGGIRTSDKEGNPKPLTYDACPKTKRKLSGNYCQKCEKVYESPVATYILNGLLFEDASGMAWSSAVGNEPGVKLLKQEPEEMKRLQYSDPETFQSKIHDALWQDVLQVKFRLSTEEYQGVPRARAQVLQCTPAKYVDCGKKALADLAKIYSHCSPSAQAAVKDLVSAWKEKKDWTVKGKAVFNSEWHDEMSRLLVATC